MYDVTACLLNGFPFPHFCEENWLGQTSNTYYFGSVSENCETLSSCYCSM
uniref:Uncharacterized protein n=1 Tax=Rhizophora mucronata TaxID=61149 RepID=A0A2P2M149_RHIMU